MARKRKPPGRFLFILGISNVGAVFQSRFCKLQFSVTEKSRLKDKVDDGIWHKAKKNCADRCDR